MLIHLYKECDVLHFTSVSRDTAEGPHTVHSCVLKAFGHDLGLPVKPAPRPSLANQLLDLVSQASSST